MFCPPAAQRSARRMLYLTHSRVLLGAIRDDLYVVTVHVVAEEIIEVRLRALAPKHVQIAVSLLEEKMEVRYWSHEEIRELELQRADWTHSVEQHAVSDAGLDILRPGVTRVFPQEAPRSGLAVVRVQAAELRLRRPTVLHAAVARQDATAECVDHVLLWVHAHLQGAEGSGMSHSEDSSWSQDQTETDSSYLVVKHQLGTPVSGRVLAEQRPGVGVNVVPVEVALQRLAVPDAGVQVAAQRVDLTPLGVDTHLVAGASARTALKHSHVVLVNQK